MLIKFFIFTFLILLLLQFFETSLLEPYSSLGLDKISKKIDDMRRSFESNLVSKKELRELKIQMQDKKDKEQKEKEIIEAERMKERMDRQAMDRLAMDRLAMERQINNV